MSIVVLYFNGCPETATETGQEARNTAINGFWAQAGHAGTHSDKLFIALGNTFKTVRSKAQAKAAMARIWKKVENGDFQ